MAMNELSKNAVNAIVSFEKSAAKAHEALVAVVSFVLSHAKETGAMDTNPLSQVVHGCRRRVTAPVFREQVEKWITVCGGFAIDSKTGNVRTVRGAKYGQEQLDKCKEIPFYDISVPSQFKVSDISYTGIGAVMAKRNMLGEQLPTAEEIGLKVLKAVEEWKNGKKAPEFMDEALHRIGNGELKPFGPIPELELRPEVAVAHAETAEEASSVH